MRRIGLNSRIAIVGGSLTGPVLALLLLKEGFENISIHEALPAAISQAGGVIGLDHESLGVLDTLGIDQDEIIPFRSERVISIKVLDRKGMKSTKQYWPGRNSTWNTLHDALMRKLPEGIMHNSHRVVDLGQEGRASLHFKKAEPVEADLLAFADGRHSIGRQVLDPRRPLRYAGYVAYRGQAAFNPDEIRDFVRFEPDRTQYNVFPIILPDGEVGLDWTFFLRTTPQEFHEAFGGDPITKSFITSPQINDEVREKINMAAKQLLPATQAEVVRRTTMRAALPVVDITPPKKMARRIGESTAVLVGDALAPVRPHTARGANNGIIEAAGLATALKQSGKFGADLGTALLGWQQRYLPLVKESIRRGPELGRALGL